MATGREARMQQRMRGAQRHQVQEAEFDLFFDLPTGLDAAPSAAFEIPISHLSPPAEPEASKSPALPAPESATPSKSNKKRRLNDGGSATGAANGSVVSQIARTIGSQPNQEEVGESPLLAPGSGRRRSVIATAAAASRTAALHQAVTADTSPSNGRSSQRQRAIPEQSQVPQSSPPTTQAGRQRASHTRIASANSNAPDDGIGSGGDNAARRNDQPSPELSTMIEVPSSNTGLGIIDSQAVMENAGQHKPKGSIFSNLPTTKRLSAASINNEAADELSSPAVGVALEPVDGNNSSGMIPFSSPLARKSVAGARAASKRNSGGSTGSRGSNSAVVPRAMISETPMADRTQAMDEPDELSPGQPVPATDKQRVSRPTRARQASEVPSSSPVTRVERRMPPQKTLRVKSKQNTIPTVEEEPQLEPGPELEPEQEEENEEAEEIDAVEAARTIGKKRPHRSTVHEPSPELGSQSTGSQPAASPEQNNRANQRRRQRDQEQSPPAQSQSRPPKKSSAKASKRVSSASASRTTTTAKKQRKQKRKRSDDGDSGNDDDELEGVEKGSRSRGAPVPITVQRFSKMRMAAVRRSHSGDGSDNDEDDELAAGGGDLPFSNRSGVNAVDVLAQICEDIVEQKLHQLQEKQQQVRQQAAEEAGNGGAAAVSAVQKEIQSARRALQSFQQELRTRLLEQVVAVDTLYAMRKRVRAVHKEKLALREEILRIRAERDQVGLRMDALRAQHQQRVGQAMQATQVSSTMFDIELAVEQGCAAPELTPAQQKTAELANLELVVRRIAAQVSGGCRDTPAGGNKGGTLDQIMEFNAFLERAAAVLEGRRLPAKAVLA